MNNPMMKPGNWANGVPEPAYAAPLLDFSPIKKIGADIAGQLKQPQTAGQPLQLTPGAGQAQPVRPQQQAGGLAPGMNAMAATADATPWASALMRMFGGQGMQAGGGINPGSVGGTNPFGGSGSAIF